MIMVSVAADEHVSHFGQERSSSPLALCYCAKLSCWCFLCLTSTRCRADQNSTRFLRYYTFIYFYATLSVS